MPEVFFFLGAVGFGEFRARLRSQLFAANREAAPKKFGGAVIRQPVGGASAMGPLHINTYTGFKRATARVAPTRVLSCITALTSGFTLLTFDFEGDRKGAPLQGLFACFRASAAGFGASLAMVMMVAAAFIGTAAAGLCADLQIRMSQLTVAHQQARGQETDISTVAVQLYAVGHGFHIIFVEAGGGTGLAGTGTVKQRIYKRLMLTARMVVAGLRMFHNFKGFKRVNNQRPAGSQKLAPG